MKKFFYSFLVLAMTAMTFSSCEDVPAPYNLPSINGSDSEEAEPTGTGSATDPFNVAAAVKYIDEGGDANVNMYVKGKVVSVDAGSYDANYGSLKYYISDDGTTNNQFRVYNGYAGPNRTKFSGEDALKAGDEVVICGSLTIVNGTKEFTTGNYVVSLNGQPIGGGDTPSAEGYINESFGSNFGSFTEKNVKGTPWVIDSYGYAKATGYDNSSKATTPSESYIVSKAIDLSASKKATLEFSYILRYVTKDNAPVAGVKNQVLVTDNYTGDPTTTKWTDITGTLTEGTDWKTWQTYSAELKDFVGKKNVVIALHYACETSSGTWEVKNLSVKEGASTPDTPETPGTSEGISINGTIVTLTNSAVTAGESIKVEDWSSIDCSNLEKITLSDGTTISLSKGTNTKTSPAYNANYNEIRLYANNAMTITGSKAIAKIAMTCANYQGTDCVGNTTATVTISGNTATYTNVFTGSTGGGTQLRIKSIEIFYAK